MENVDTSDLMMIRRWVINISCRLSKHIWISLTHTTLHVAKKMRKVTKKTNYILDTPSTEYDQQTFTHVPGIFHRMCSIRHVAILRILMEFQTLIIQTHLLQGIMISASIFTLTFIMCSNESSTENIIFLRLFFRILMFFIVSRLWISLNQHVAQGSLNILGCKTCEQVGNNYRTWQFHIGVGNELVPHRRWPITRGNDDRRLWRDARGPFHWHMSTLMPAWIRNDMPSKPVCNLLQTYCIVSAGSFS